LPGNEARSTQHCRLCTQLERAGTELNLLSISLTVPLVLSEQKGYL